jgi:sugar O-acyltransferase (sialic acid O-acetyltransferase NeuD family)
MSKPDIILIGAGGHARSCIDVIEQCDKFNIVGLVGLPEEMHAQHYGYSVIATDDDLQKLANEYQYAIVTTGQIQSADTRIRLYQQAIKEGFELPTIIAPSSNISKHATIGAGTIVFHGAMINAGVRVGHNCIINTCSLLEHDVLVDDHCHVATGAILLGDVKIGSESFVGSGSLIREGVSIGKNCIVGMGLSVRHNLVTNGRFVGNNKSDN